MYTHSTSAGQYQQNKVTSNAASLIELLAAIALGVFGMFLAELGAVIDNPIVNWSGIVASVSAAGYITMKFLAAIRDFIWDFIDRYKNNSKS